jgi:EmrB/QacA subfamily drug resistance transporter
MEGEARHAARPGVILAVLSLAGGAYALVQSLIVPALPELQKELHASPAGAAWLFTAYLLSASIATPIAGRLGDMFGKRRFLVIVVGALAAGSLLGGLATTLPLMILARTVQGIGGAVFPLAFAIVRDEFPRERIAGAIALISGLLGIGAGVGILLAGPIIENLSYHWLFWIPFVFALVAMVAARVLIPESPIRAPGEVHWVGAILLSGWLVALLLGVSEAPTWGWGSPKTLTLLTLAAVLAVLWVRAERHSRDPLVDMEMMGLRGVWTPNLAALLAGFGMYSAFVLIPQYVQAPESTGYGFGASVTEAGLFLLPSTICVIVFSLVGGKLSTTVGSKVPLVLGSCMTLVSFLIMALAHAPAGFYFASGFLGAGVGLAFASLANLVVHAVRPDQTGIASGMNTIIRTIGGAIGAQVAASILAVNLVAGGYPDRHGYTVTFVLDAAILVLGVLASLAVPRPGRIRAEAPEPAAAAGS